MYRGRVAREVRQQAAKTLKEKRDSRSTTEQLRLLAKRPGSSAKEKARLIELKKKEK